MTQTASEETLSSIGNTPLVKLDSLSGSAGDFYAKLEGHNPFGSVKDRAAYWMIKDGEERGKLVSGKSIIIEPTSGNTGIALTGIANILGYKVEIVIPEKASQETKDIIKNLGAKVFETDALCLCCPKLALDACKLALFAVFNHPVCSPIFYRTKWIVTFEFCIKISSRSR